MYVTHVIFMLIDLLYLFDIVYTADSNSFKFVIVKLIYNSSSFSFYPFGKPPKN